MDYWLCFVDVYDLDDVDFRYQNWASADIPLTIKFDADVYNVRIAAVSAAPTGNFALKVYISVLNIKHEVQTLIVVAF